MAPRAKWHFWALWRVYFFTCQKKSAVKLARDQRCTEINFPPSQPRWMDAGASGDSSPYMRDNISSFLSSSCWGQRTAELQRFLEGGTLRWRNFKECQGQPLKKKKKNCRWSNSRSSECFVSSGFIFLLWNSCRCGIYLLRFLTHRLWPLYDCINWPEDAGTVIRNPFLMLFPEFPHCGVMCVWKLLASSPGSRSDSPCVLQLLSAGLGASWVQGGEHLKRENLDFVHLCSFPVPIKLLSQLCGLNTSSASLL